jgi:transposase-like protein
MTTALPARHRRNHSIEFKTKLVTICSQPGVSVSAVAQAHGVNANLLRRWMKQYPVEAHIPAASAPAKLVPVQIETDITSPSNGEIHFDIQRGTTRIHIRWPLTGAAACAQLLGAWLK